MIELTDSDFDTTISQGKTLVCFTSPSCAPCQMFKGVMAKVEQEIPGVTFALADVEGAPLAAAKRAVRILPTICLFKDGDLDQLDVGAMSAIKLRELVGCK